MKGSRGFILFILLFLLVMFVVQYNMPKKFVWHPTYSHTDRQPFGAALLDEFLTASLPNGYTVSKKTFHQLAQEDSTQRRTILMVAEDFYPNEADLKALLRMAERGDQLLLAATWFGNLADTLKFNTFGYANLRDLKRFATSKDGKDSLYWVGNPIVYSPDTFYAYIPLCNSYFTIDSLNWDTLAVRKNTEALYYDEVEVDTVSVTDSSVEESEVEAAVPYIRDTLLYRLTAMTIPWGKGKIVLSSTPRLFTNYGVVDGKNATYLLRILSQVSQYPVVRTEAYTAATAQDEQSPFRYLLSKEPLRWALYLTVAAILLFMIFTAKRRQRVIPVMRKPANRSLEFAELIGTLYFQKKDHADLVRKKYTYFAEELRREIQVDIEDATDDDRSFRRIASKTGMESEEVTCLIREVRIVVYGGRRVSDSQMKKYIDQMNELIKHI